MVKRKINSELNGKGCQIDHIFQDFLDPYKKSALVIIGLPIENSVQLLNYVTIQGKLSVQHVSADHVNQVLRSNVYGLGEIKDQAVSVIIFGTEKQAEAALKEVKDTVIRTELKYDDSKNLYAEDIIELTSFITSSSYNKESKLLTTTEQKLSKFIADLQENHNSKNENKVIDEIPKHMVLSDFQESEVSSLFEYFRDTDLDFHIRYQRAWTFEDTGSRHNFYRYGVCKKWNNEIHREIEDKFPDLFMQLISENCSLQKRV